jgi:hypothetical protein
MSEWVSKEIEVFDSSDATLTPIKQFYLKADKFCSGFRDYSVPKGPSLRDKAEMDSNNQLKSFSQRIKAYNPKRHTYKSLNQEKELKKTKKIEYFTKTVENLKKSGNAKFTNLEEDDIEEIEGESARTGRGISNLSSGMDIERRNMDILRRVSEKSLEVAELRRVDTSDKVMYVADLYERMEPKSMIAVLENELFEKLQCAMCFNEPVDCLGAKCGHLACKECWENQFKFNKFECPTCRKKVRKKKMITVKKKVEIIAL